jgi:hypothetical protein
MQSAASARLTRVTLGHTRALHLALLASICVLPLLLQLRFLNDPLWGDEAVYSVIAHGLLNGRMPYVDLLDNKPPLLYCWYALSYVVFGDDVASPRLMMGLALSATTLLLYIHAAMTYGRVAGYLAAFLFALMTALPKITADSSSESFMLLPMVGSFVFLAIGLREQAVRWFVLAGLMGGAAVMTKPVALWPLLALMCIAAIRGRQQHSGLRSLRPVAAMVASAAILGIVAITPFVLTGTLGEFIDANVGFNLHVRDYSRTWEDRIDSARTSTVIFLGIASAPLAIALPGLIASIRHPRSRYAFLLLVWTFGCIVGIASPGLFGTHHYVQLLPSVALLAGASFVCIRGMPAIWRRRLLLVGFGPVFVLLCIQIVITAIPYLQPTPEQRHEARSVGPVGTARENSNQALASQLRLMLGPAGSFYVFGGATKSVPLYIYTDRLPPTRYFYDADFRTPPRTKDWVTTYQQLVSDPPAIILDATLWETDRLDPLPAPPEFWQLLDERYEYLGRIEYADVYRLKTPPASTAGMP